MRAKPAVVLRMLGAMQSYRLQMSVPHYNVAIDSCGRRSQWVQALSLLHDMTVFETSPTVVSYTSTIRACCEATRWSLALNTLQQALTSMLPPDAMLFGVAMNGCAASGKWELAASILSSMSDFRVEPGVVSYNILMNALEKSGDWRKVLQLLFKELPSNSIQPNTVSGNTVITAAARHSKWPLIMSFLACMPDLGMLADADTFSVSLQAMAKSWRWEEGLCLFAKMFEQKVRGEALHCNWVMSACRSSSQWQCALALLGDPKTRHLLDLKVYTTAIAAAASQKAWPVSLALLAELPAELSVDVMAYVAALSACSEAPWQHGLCLLADLKLQRLFGNLLTHTPVLSACSRAVQWQSALMVLAELQDQVVKVDRVAYTSVLHACVDASHWRKALALFEEMQHCRLHVDAPALNVAISACEKGGDWRRALLLVSAFVSERNSGTCTAAISACGDKSWQQALWLLQLWHDTLEDDSESSMCSVYTAAISSCGVAGQWQQVLALLGSMVEATVADGVAFNAALSAVGRRRWQVALDMFAHLQSSSQPLDSISYSAAMSACIEASQWKISLALLEESRDRSIAASISMYNIAIRAWTRCAEWQMALSFMWQAQDERLQCDLMTQGSAVHACGCSSKWPVALQVLRATRACDLQPGNEAFGAVLYACQLSHSWSLAISILQSMSRAEMRPSLAAYDYTLLAADSSGHTQQALQVMIESDDLRSPASFLWALATLRTSDPEVIRAACAESLTAALATTTDAKSLSMIIWSTGMLGARIPVLDRLLQKAAEKQLASFSLEELSMMSAGASAANSTSFLQLALAEIADRTSHISGAALEKFSFADGAMEVLGIIFSCRTAGCLQTGPYLVLLQMMRSVGCRLDSRSRRFASTYYSSNLETTLPHHDKPRVVTDLADRAAVLKPEGWEVYGGHVKLQLLGFVRGMFGCAPIFQDPDHNHGFLHRLDVPSSGLILVAKTYEAFYDLQVQLHAGEVTRDYTVLCHGWLPQSVSEIRARTWCEDDRPTLSGGRGKPSCTQVQSSRRLWHKVGALSKVVLGIATGRKHQIRSHLAHIGHPTVRDHHYSGITTFNFDILLCGRNALHRHRLRFRNIQGQVSDIFSDLPRDLKQALDESIRIT